MCVWQTFQSNPNHAYAAHHHQPSYFHHLPFTIHQEDKAATAEQNHTAHTVRMCYVLSMCYVLRVMCYVSTPMVRSEFHSLTL